MATRDRLKNELFYNGACPNASDYAEVFDSTINFNEDGVEPPKRGNPLHIKSQDGSYNALKITGNLVFPTTGNVGIGTNNPQAELHVNGDVKINGNLLEFRGNKTGSSFKIKAYNGQTLASFIDGEMQPNHEVHLVAQGGKVGIGTSAPKAALHVEGDVKINGKLFELKSIKIGSSFKIEARNGQNLASFIDGDVQPNHEVHLVAKGGKVGIGTSAPEATLHVSGNIRADNILIEYISVPLVLNNSQGGTHKIMDLPEGKLPKLVSISVRLYYKSGDPRNNYTFLPPAPHWWDDIKSPSYSCYYIKNKELKIYKHTGGIGSELDECNGFENVEYVAHIWY